MTRTKHVGILSFLLVIFLSIRESQSYGTGAPGTPTLCSSMTPEHRVQPQTSQSPYVIEIDKTEVTGGQSVKITLTSRDKQTPFQGFLVMGQKYKAPGLLTAESPEGKLGVGTNTDSKIVQSVQCGGKSEGAMTHTSIQDKNEVQLEWIAPNEDAEYMIL